MKQFQRTKCVCSLVAWQLFLISLCITLNARTGNAGPKAVLTADGIAEIAARFCKHLSIESRVRVTIHEKNEKLVSVVPVSNAERTYLLAFDREFLESLTDEEIAAAVAHELGHVWIYTHHPFLHTEALANQVALRLVDRDILSRVYTKMWARLGVAGDMEAFLGPDIPPNEKKFVTLVEDN